MTETFECDLRSLLGQEVFFYDPYIVDEVRTMIRTLVKMQNTLRSEEMWKNHTS